MGLRLVTLNGQRLRDWPATVHSYLVVPDYYEAAWENRVMRRENRLFELVLDFNMAPVDPRLWPVIPRTQVHMLRVPTAGRGGGIPRIPLADYWEKTPDSWIRHHVVVRRECWSPLEECGGPGMPSCDDIHSQSYKRLGGAATHI